MAKKVFLETIGYIRVITISNEEKRNAFTVNMVEELKEVAKTIANDREARCVIIKGSGTRSFSSGHDFEDVLAAFNNKEGINREEPNIFTFPLDLEIPV